MKLSQLPHLTGAVAFLAQDNGMSRRGDFEIPEEWKARFVIANHQAKTLLSARLPELDGLYSDLLEALTIGDEDDQALIMEHLEVGALNDVLNEVFDGELSLELWR